MWPRNIGPFADHEPRSSSAENVHAPLRVPTRSTGPVPVTVPTVGRRHLREHRALLATVVSSPRCCQETLAGTARRTPGAGTGDAGAMDSLGVWEPYDVDTAARLLRETDLVWWLSGGCALD